MGGFTFVDKNVDKFFNKNYNDNKNVVSLCNKR
jgi:hypothetical protein